MPFVIKKKMKIILIVWGVKQNVAEELFEIVVAIVNMHLKILMILFEIKYQKWHWYIPKT